MQQPPKQPKQQQPRQRRHVAASGGAPAREDMCARMVSMCSSHTACRLSRASVLWQACAKLGRRVVAYASADFQLDFLMWASCSTVPACTARGELGACPSNPRIRLCCRCLVGDAPLATAQVSSHTDRVARIESGGSRRTDPVGRNGVERTKERGGEERDYPKGPGRRSAKVGPTA